VRMRGAAGEMTPVGGSKEADARALSVAECAAPPHERETRQLMSAPLRAASPPGPSIAAQMYEFVRRRTHTYRYTEG
jgi:hypothetical protein